MIRIGSLVKLSDRFYSITINTSRLKDVIGIVVGIEPGFYFKSYDRGGRVDRCKVLFGEEISYEPATALTLVEYD